MDFSTDELQSIANFQLALSGEIPPPTLYRPRKSWSVVPQLQTQDAWPIRPPSPFIRRERLRNDFRLGFVHKTYRQLREECLDRGMTFLQTNAFLRQEAKTRRAQARARAEGLRIAGDPHHCFISTGRVDQNPFWLNAKKEKTLQEKVCSNQHVPCRVWTEPRQVRGQHFSRKSHPRDAFRKQAADKQQVWPSIDWRVRRAERRRKMFILRSTCLLPCQKRAVIEGWLPLEDIVNFSVFHRSCSDCCKIPGFQDFLSSQLEAFNRFSDPFIGQMEEQDAHGLSGVVNSDKKADVVLEDNRDVSLASPFSNSSVDSYASFAIAPKPMNESTTADRWLTIGSFVWPDSKKGGEVLQSMTLPKFVIDQFPNSPNIMPFLQHVYWRGNMKIKIVVNSNLRQYGQLQCRFYYGKDREDQNDFNTCRMNVYSGSQMPHCLVTANTSNVGVLDVPFQYFRPLLFVGNNGKVADLGQLIIAVLVPLTLAEGTEKQCRVSILVSFEDNQFSGQVYRTMEAEILPQLINRAFKFLNLDKPTDVQSGNVLLPQNTGSWSAGTNVNEWCVPLRLDPLKVLPYGPGRIPNLDEMNVKHLTSIFGLVRSIHWTTQKIQGDVLYTFDASPTWEFSKYPQISINDVTCAILPPISVLSHMFCYWRGGMTLRIDVVGAADLSGRFVVAYVPRFHSDTITIKNLVCCPHAVFDLQEKRQFTFNIPYLTDRMFWPARRSLDAGKLAHIPPGKVFIMVYNDLISNRTIPSDCYLNIYLAGAEDFELSVPSTPTIGAAFDPVVFTSLDTDLWCQFKEHYYPAYTGQWRNFGDSKKYILRYGGITDHVCQMEGPKIAELVGKVLKPTKTYECYSKVGGNNVLCKWFCLYFDKWPNPNYYYLIPFTNKSNADIFARDVLTPSAPNLAENFVQEQADYSYPSQMTFVQETTSISYPRRTFASGRLYGQMDERSTTGTELRPIAAPASTGAGAAVLGENFSDLKDLCRRYQLYAFGKTKVTPKAALGLDIAQLRFPVMPQGLALDTGVPTHINEYWNRTREGVIPLVASGFKFFTGGLRFRIIINTYDDQTKLNVSSKIFVQHRPIISNLIPQVNQVNYARIQTEDFLMPGFAYHIQMQNLNNIVSVEVPYYLPNVRGYLQRPPDRADSSLTHSLGELVVSVRTNTTESFWFDYEIHYSLADDARFSLFQGFPPMISITDIPPLHGKVDAIAFKIEEKEEEEETGSPASSTFVPLPPPPPPVVDLGLKRFEEFSERFSIPSFIGLNLINYANQCKNVTNIPNRTYDSLITFISGFNTDAKLVALKATLTVFYYHWLVKGKIKKFDNCFEEVKAYEYYNLHVRSHPEILLWEHFSSIWAIKKPLSGQMLEDVRETIGAVGVAAINAASVDTDLINQSALKFSLASENVARTAAALQEELAHFKSGREKAMKLGSKLEKLVDNVNAGTDQLKMFFNPQESSNPFEEDDEDGSVFNDIMDKITSVTINVANFAVNLNFSTFLTTVYNLFREFNLFKTKVLNKVFEALRNWLQRKFCGSSEHYEEPIVGQIETEDTALASYISTLIASVAGVLNFSSSIRSDKLNLSKILLRDLKDFSMTANHLFTFCRNNIECIKVICDYFFKREAGLDQLEFFEEYSKEIFDWAKDVMIITDGGKRDALFGDIAQASKVYDLANQACLINLRLLELERKQKFPVEKRVVITELVKKITKLRDDLARAHVAPPVKFEPFVLHITGDHGIGKSHLIQELPIELLKHIGYRSYTEPTYTRSPGNQYWNGLAHQPIVIYDDWYQITDPDKGTLQLAEFFNLKTRAVYNPPMAAIEDKNIRYNPLMVVLSSNTMYPKYHGVQCSAAVHRRMDQLIHVRLTAEYRGIANFDPNRDVPADVKAVYGHLEFCFMPRQPDPLPTNLMNRADAVGNRDAVRFYLPYAAMKEVVQGNFLDYYRAEYQKFSSAMRRITSLYPTNGEECFKLPHSDFYMKSEEYLKYVDPADLTFKKKYDEMMYCLKDGKIKSLREALCRIFSWYRPQSDEEIGNSSGEFVTPDNSIPPPETPLDRFMEHRTWVETGDGEDACLQMEHANCIHHLLSYFHFETMCPIVWNDALQSWQVEVDYMSALFFFDEYKKMHKDEELDGIYWFHSYLEDLLQEKSVELKAGIPIIPFLLEVELGLPDGLRVMHFPKNEVYYEMRTGLLLIPHKFCQFNLKCNFSPKLRTKLCYDYIQRDHFLKDCLQNGESLVGKIPQHFIDGLNGVEYVPEEVFEKLNFLQSIWIKLKKQWSQPWKHTFYRWLCRISWLLAICGPLLLFVTDMRSARKRISNYVSNVCEKGKLDSHLGDLAVQVVKELKAQGFVSGDHKVSGTKNTPKLIANKALGPVGGQMSDEEFTTLRNSLLRNTFYLFCDNRDVSVTGRALGIYGNVAIMPYHYWENMLRFKETGLFYYIPCSKPVGINISFNDIKCIPFQNSALCLIKLPRNIPLFKNITSRFATQYMHSKINGNGLIVEVTKPEQRELTCNINSQYVHFSVWNNIEVVGSENRFNDFTVADGYCYDGFAGKGKCGSVLLATNLPQGIVGMHVAGNEQIGVAEAITQEMLSKSFEIFGQSFSPEEPPLFSLNKCRTVLNVEVLGLGRVEAKYAHRESEKSRIKASLIQQQGSREDFPIYTDVAVLSPHDPRLDLKFSPMVEGCNFHGMPLKAFSSDDLAVIYDDIKNMYLANCKPARFPVGKLTKLQVCAGIDGLDGYDALEWRTSEGYPFVAHRPRGVHDKRWLFDFVDNKCVGLSRALKDVIATDKRKRLEGIVPFTVFTDCLKDTTVSLEKVLLPGKTRIFSMAPVNFTIAQRQYTLDFSVAMMRNRLNLEHAVGINPDSYEWTQLAVKLLEKGSKIVTGDFSKFGDTIPFEFIEMFFQVLVDWYNYYSAFNCPEHDLIRRVMMYEIAQAIHLMFDFVYKVLCGQPSGNALTVLINSFANSVYLRLAWLHIMAKTIYAGLASFKKHVCAFSYGDDIIFSVSDEVAPYFNAQTLHDFFALYGLKFTNADKSDRIVPWTSLGEADFLKRSFKPHPTRYEGAIQCLLAPLSCASIEDTVNWVWDSGYNSCDANCPEFKRMCLQVCEDATRNAWTRGPIYYNHFCSKLRKFWLDRGVYVCYDTWDTIDTKVFDLGTVLNDYSKFKGIVEELKI